jgi:hypothetical protein
MNVASMMSQMQWASWGSSTYAYRILQDPTQQIEIPHFERVNASKGCCGLGILCGCMQLPSNYLPGIKNYDVPTFLKDSVAQEDWRALAVRFNLGMSDVRELSTRPPGTCVTIHHDMLPVSPH